MACHLHPILCTWNAVTTCTPVTIFFPLEVQLCSKKKARKKAEGIKQLPFKLSVHNCMAFVNSLFSLVIQHALSGFMFEYISTYLTA